MDLIYFKATILRVFVCFSSDIEFAAFETCFLLNGGEPEGSLTEKLSGDVGSRGEGTFVSTQCTFSHLFSLSTNDTELPRKLFSVSFVVSESKVYCYS